jgi:Cu(I)/Ag(I) efflux system membrane protein CusA/SilA
MYALVDKTGTHDLAQLRSLQDWYLKYELQSVEGVSEVASMGGMVRQYQIEVDPIALTALDLSITDVAEAIKRGNAEQSASVVEMAEAEYMVRLTGYIEDLADVESLLVATRAEGAPITVGDVARVSFGPAMRRGVADLNGRGEVAGGIVVMRSGENAQATIERVKAKLVALQPGLGDGIDIVTVYDRSKLIDRSIDNLLDKLGQELLVVALVCMVFLMHMRSSVVALISLPLGILGAFVIMRVQGLNANIMSLGGIAIAVGAMSDGAIVMTETSTNTCAKKLQPRITGKLLSNLRQKWAPRCSLAC